jgi:hypothetical protein
MSMSMDIHASAAARFAAMPDEALFGLDMVWEGEGEALKSERQKRTQAREQERIRIEREREERIRLRKDAVTYSAQLAHEICERIASGELLTVICLEDHMPTVRRCNQWLREHSDFKCLYEQSLQDRLSIFEEQLVELADSASRHFEEVKIKGVTKRVRDPVVIQGAKLSIEVRRLHLIAGKPQKWGSSTTLITKSDDGFDPANLSADELEKQIAEFERKSRIVKVA